MMDEVRGENILIIGYGREGQSLHRYLLQHYAGLRIGVADRAPVSLISEASPGTKLHTGADYLQAVKDYDTIFHSPGISLAGLRPGEMEGPKHISTSTNLFFSKVRGMTIGVTGTKGKSTTSALIAAILKEHFADVRLAGNIGYPMLEELAAHGRETVFVLELSSFQLSDIRYSPRLAVLLKIVPEHLDLHGSFESYAHAKANITRFQTPEDCLILNPQFAELLDLTGSSAARRCLFSEQPQEGLTVFTKDHSIFGMVEGQATLIIAREDLALPGPGNLQNIMAAITCALTLGVPLEKIRAALRKFKALEHRLELAGCWRGIRFYNDSLATTPQALINALEALGPDVQTLIAGGYDRGLDYAVLGPAINASAINNLILFPTTGEKIRQALSAAGARKTINVFAVTSMSEAVKLAYEHTSAGKICLMSPAASSFNIFKDYRDRGEQFKHYARALSQNRQ